MSTASIQSPVDHPGKCKICDSRIVMRCGLSGYLGTEPYCQQCLRKAAPQIGWALTLLNETGSLLNGKWPTKPDGAELLVILQILQRLRTVFRRPVGNRHQRQERKLTQAMKVIADYLESTRQHLRTAAQRLGDAQKKILEPMEAVAPLVDPLLPDDES